jgi:hypothetical protein
MATSSRQSSIFGTNDWKTIYKTFSQADFQSYDYETLRKSFVDYLRLYYPETFNDYTESSEYIALMDVIAFMGQSLAFRNDLNTRENFIDTAERRDSVVKLANLIGYNPKRSLAGQGTLKITSISTTENVKDMNGLSLSNTVVLWNDPTNANWQEQFNTIINAALINSQRIGRPGNTASILGIKTDEYSISIPPGQTPIVPFSASVDGITMAFEGVSVTSVNEDYLYEIPPGPTGIFNILYKNDKLGYGSPSTGFFMYFKQGSLQPFDFSIEQQVSNQTIDVDVQGINNTDTWLYQYDSNTNNFTQWEQVESVYANTNLKEQNSLRKVFSVISRFNDQVSYAFGDGVFSEIPVGSFRAFVRAGNASQYTIDPAEMQGTSVSINYVSRVGRVETITLNLELPVPISNAQTRESLTEIKERAPTRYYTQNRMVNGEDYNNFPYTMFSSIIKSKALNRGSIGVSRNFDLVDPTGKYSSINSFAEDGGLYQDSNNTIETFIFNSNNDIYTFLAEKIRSILAGHRAQQYYVQNYPRYTVTTSLNPTPILWKQVAFDNANVNGYFYITLPIATGEYSTTALKYVSPGALIKFEAPTGYYFDGNNRLISGIPPSIESTYFWTSVLQVIGDGYNGGDGTMVNGLGPITLAGFVPSTAKITEIIPVFDNLFPPILIQEIVDRMGFNQSFKLQYDNGKLASKERWDVVPYTDTGWFVNFDNTGDNSYTVTIKALSYYFGSVRDTRFLFDQSKVVYDPLSGLVMRDTIAVLKTNQQPNTVRPLAKEIVLDVVGQNVESDGYVNDFAVEISTSDLNNNNVLRDPDFFKTLTAYVEGSTNTKYFAFFEQSTDPNLLTRNQLISTDKVIYTYSTISAIELVKYEYPIGQIFYAYGQNRFYKIVEDPIKPNIVYMELQQIYSVKTGRQGLFFQYKHVSNNTTRIDPSTSNIIDLYIVAQSYYIQYQNWLRDTTNTVALPDIPTLNELQQEYGQLNDYKMISDSVILNSVRFKPLFGSKAEPQLRATIKVIRSSTTTASDSEIRSKVIEVMNNYFSIENWDFGDIFYFSELSAYLHSQIGDLINSAVLVPTDTSLQFGDLYEIRSAPYEIFVNAAQATDIVVISALTPMQLQITK